MLNAEGNDGELRYPVIGSKVWVAISLRNEASIFQFDLLDTYILITQTLTQFNDGSFGGLVKVNELLTKINRLESNFNSHIHSGVTTGGGVSGTVATPITPPTQLSDLENKKITHGK